jgi:type IV pilus assembly protein PilE
MQQLSVLRTTLGRDSIACARHGHVTGFTLIELMIAVTVVAILAAIAMPAYQDQVRRGARATAQSAMLDVAARQRQFVIDRRAYATSFAELGIVEPASVAGKYAVTIEAPADARPPAFRIVATPVGSQASDRCGVLRVDEAGARTPAGCW